MPSCHGSWYAPPCRDARPASPGAFINGSTLSPDLVGAIDAPVGLPDTLNVRRQGAVTLSTLAAQLGIALMSGMAPIAGRGDCSSRSELAMPSPTPVSIWSRLTHSLRGLGHAADLGDDGFNSRPQKMSTRLGARAPCEQHVRGSRGGGGRVRLLVHGSILSEKRASSKPGTVQSGKHRSFDRAARTKK